MSEPLQVNRRRVLATLLRSAFAADPWRATLTLVLASTAAVSAMVLAYWTKLIVDAAARTDGHAARVAAAGLVLTGMASLGAILALVQVRFRLQESTAHAIEVDMINQISSLPGIDHHENPAVLDELELLRSQRSQIASAVELTVEVAAAVLRLGVTLLLLAAVSPVLLSLVLIGVPGLVVTARSNRSHDDLQRELSAPTRKREALADLALSAEAGKELRIFGATRRIRELHDAEWDHVEGRIYTHWRRRTWALTAAELLFNLGYLGALALTVRRVLAGHAGPGDLMLVAGLGATVNSQLRTLQANVGSVQNAFLVMSRYLWLVDFSESHARRDAANLPAPDRLTDGIHLRGVDFAYPGVDRDVLVDVDIALPAGSTVAVVGANGAGKSTLVKLLAAFYQPNRGEVSVDGTPLDQLSVTGWRARMTAGFQDFMQYEVTAGWCVGLGDLPRLDDEAAHQRALQVAGGEDVIASLPDGWASQLGRSWGGSELSLGQWQKLALARTNLRAAPLLVLLDEPTASLDAEAEHQLYERFRLAGRAHLDDVGGVTLLVSHRFSTAATADLIVVLDEGRVAESGTHAELTERGGVYAELFTLQANAYQ